MKNAMIRVHNNRALNQVVQEFAHKNGWGASEVLWFETIEWICYSGNSRSHKFWRSSTMSTPDGYQPIDAAKEFDKVIAFFTGPDPIVVNGHTVEFKGDHIKVGCTAASKETVLEIAKRLQEAV
jgi:hypothetical protein